MKDFLKDYGTLVGPIFAFMLGVIAIYLKFQVDRQVDRWKSIKKLGKLIQLIRESTPPPTYFPNKGENELFHADQARNLSNATIFSKRIAVVKSFMDSIEEDLFTNCSVLQIQQFSDLKFIVSHLTRDIERYKNGIMAKNEDYYNESHEFNSLKGSFDRLITVCEHPQKEFNYSGG